MKCEKMIKRMMGRRIFAFLAVVLMVSFYAAAEENTALSLSVQPGKSWKTTTWYAFIPVAKTPQFAAWIETADGLFVKPLVVTARAERNEWRGNPEGGRPEALPVWFHAVSSGTRAGVDAASSATPEGDVSVAGSSDGLVAGKEYRVRLEVNVSFDYNDAWPKNAKAGAANYSGVNGQPSVVYEAAFVAGKTGSVELLPVGKGSIDGRSASVTPGVDGLTTALEIIEKAVLETKEE